MDTKKIIVIAPVDIAVDGYLSRLGESQIKNIGKKIGEKVKESENVVKILYDWERPALLTKNFLCYNLIHLVAESNPWSHEYTPPDLNDLLKEIEDCDREVLILISGNFTLINKLLQAVVGKNVFPVSEIEKKLGKELFYIIDIETGVAEIV